MSTDAPVHKVGRPRASPRQGGGLSPREQVLDAAASLFAEFGYAATSTRAIADRVGIRQASLYYHFTGKDDILLELLEASVRPSLAFVDRLLAADDSAAALYALALIDVRTLLETPHNIGTLYLAHEVQQPRFDIFRAHREELRTAYVTLTSTHVEDASFIGTACMQLVEMVISLRRDGDPGAEVAASIGAACLRLLGIAPHEQVHATEAGTQLLLALDA